MADQRVSELNALTGANVAVDDLFMVVDSSEPESKSITAPELSSAMLLQTATKQVLSRLEQASRDLFNGQVNCFDRTQPLVNPTGSTGTRLTTTSQYHRWRYEHRARVSCGDLRVVFANLGLKPFSGSSQGESGPGNAIWVSGYFTDVSSSVNFDFTFKGNRVIKLGDFNESGTPSAPILAISDYIPTGFDADELLYGLYLVRVGLVGNFIPTGLLTASATLVEGTSAGDVHGSANSGGGAAGFHPWAILGTPVKGTIFSYAIAGDSIAQGSGASTSGGIPNYGWVRQAFLNVPHMVVMGGGSKLGVFDVATYPKLRIIPGLIGTHKATIFCQGANDIASSTTLANLKTYLKEGVRQACRNGAKRIILCTMLPYTDTKVDWTTLNGQVPGAGGSPVTLGAAAITNATPPVVTSAAHGLTDGQRIYLSDCGNIGPGFYYIKDNAGTPGGKFDLYLDSGLTSPATSSGTYSSTHAQYAGVTATQNEQNRQDYNTWLRDGTAASEIASINSIIPVDVWDLALLVETNSAGTLTANGGYWKASNTADGLHPNDTGHTAIAAGVATLHAALEAGAY